MKKNIYHSIVHKKNKKIAVLIDPDKADNSHIKALLQIAEKALIDFFFRRRKFGC